MYQVCQEGYLDNLLGSYLITSLGVYVNFDFSKCTAPTVVHQRIELEIFGSESQCSSTEQS